MYPWHCVLGRHLVQVGLQAHPQSANLPALINYLAEGMGEPSAAQLIQEPPRGSSIQDWLQQGRAQPLMGPDGADGDQAQARMNMVREMLRQANVLRPGSASGGSPSGHASGEPNHKTRDGALEGEVRSRETQGAAAANGHGHQQRNDATWITVPSAEPLRTAN